MRGRGEHAWGGGEACVAVGACMAKGACVAGGVRGRKNGTCSGRYVSYWNTFLFDIK